MNQSDHAAAESQAGSPASSETVRPTFIYIGGDRCGSKSLHNIFRQHPDCFVPPIADPYFFDRHYDRGLDWYFSLFESAPSSVRAIGEFSHDYIHSVDAAHRIAADLPNVKLLVTLRHPIDRTFSSYASAHSAGVIRTSFDQALKEVPMLIENSLYADKLDAYFGIFDRRQVNVQFFDDLEVDPKAFAANAFEFVGLNLRDDIDYGQKMSQLSAPQFPLSGVLSKQAANLLRRLGWVNILGRAKSNPRIRAIFYKPYSDGNKPTMSFETRRMLREVFAPQIDRLEKLLDRDLSNWRE